MKVLLTEKSVTDLPVRTIVRQLINIIKSQQYGEYHLPEDIEGTNEYEYSFNKLPYFSIEFIYGANNTIDEYRVNGALLDDNDTIAIELFVNPLKFPGFIYDLIADLNDLIRHEIEHVYQENFMRPESEIDSGDPDVKTPKGINYYKQPHEIPAQIKGLRRIAKLRKLPIEKVIDWWFKRHKNIHGLPDKDIDKLVGFLSKKYHEYYDKK